LNLEVVLLLLQLKLKQLCSPEWLMMNDELPVLVSVVDFPVLVGVVDFPVLVAIVEFPVLIVGVVEFLVLVLLIGRTQLPLSL